MSKVEAPWDCQVHPSKPRGIPAEVRAILSRPDSVENLTDGLKSLGIDSYVAFPSGTVATPDFGVQVGSILTLRYVPKRVRSDDNRLGHDLIARTLTPGDILVADQHGCRDGITGGNAIGKLQRVGARAMVVSGSARDYAETHAQGFPAISTNWGIASGKTSVELVSIGSAINFCGTAVHPGDVAVVNQWGMVLIPEVLEWNDLLVAAKLA